MNERDLETRLRSAYRSRAGRADPGALSERVHSIPATVEPERRRFWHRFRSDATRRVGPGGAQVRGASNMLTATRIAAVVAALALGTTFLAAQVGGPPEAPQPGAPTPEDSVMVTGTQVITGEGPDVGFGFAYTARREGMSDPRLDGEVLLAFDEDHHGDEPIGAKQEPHVVWGTVTVTNDEGSWQGHSIGFVDEQNVRRQMAWFEGHGAYEGLAFIEQFGNPISGGRMDLVGFLYEGELPPLVVPAPGPVTE
jgi:hypothetical protein